MKTLISSKEWQRFDSNHRLHYKHYAYSSLSTNYHGMEIVRVQPYIEHNGEALPLMNADHIITFHQPSGEWHGYRSDAARHLHQLTKRSPRKVDVFGRSRFANSADVLLRRMKLNVPNGNLRKLFVYDGSFGSAPVRAAYHLPLTTGPMGGHRHLFVDAETGGVLHGVASMRHLGPGFSSPAFVFPQGYNGTDSDIRLVNLTDLSAADQRQTPGIRGLYHRTANTCPYYLCDPTGPTTRNQTTCEQSDVICFDSDRLDSILDSRLASRFSGVHSDAVPRQLNFTFTAHANLIDLAVDWEALGFRNLTVYLRYTGLPAMASRVLQNANLSFTNSWTDRWATAGYNHSSELDGLGEVQVYYAGQRWFQFIRQKFTQQFCTLGNQSAAQCSQLQDSVFNQTDIGGPLMMVTNLLAAYPSAEEVLAQINLGHGRTAADPITLNFTGRLLPFDNAFFYSVHGSDYAVTAGSASKADRTGSNKRKSCADNSECLYALGSPDKNMMGFGQGASHDWTMDACINAHEMMHSITNRLVPWLADFGRSERFGSFHDPGMLSEGWSDYWAAVHCGRTDLSTGWIKAMNRSVRNEYQSCNDQVPGRTSLTGEIHDDSRVFSGALWELRDWIGQNRTAQTQSAAQADLAQSQFDELVLAAAAMSAAVETVASQLNRLLDLISGSQQLSEFTADARRIFQRRELNCTRRIFDYSWQAATSSQSQVILSSLYIPGTEQAPIADYVPAPLQLRITTQFDSTILLQRRLNFKWTQTADDRILFPGSTFGYALQPLLFAVSWQCPAEFRFVNSSVKPFNSCTNQTLNNVGWSRAVLSSPISAERSIYGYISIDVPAQYTADDAAYIVIFNPNPLPIHLQSVKGLYVKDPVPMIAASGALMVILLAIMPFVSKYI